MMRRILVLAMAVLVAAGVMAPAPAGSAPTAPAAPYCGITWGSLPKISSLTTTAPITNLRAGRHDCFDRLVFDLGAPAVPFPGQGVGFHVAYVPVVTQDGSGEPIPLAGGAFLQVTVHASAYDTNTGAPTYTPADRRHAVDVAGFTTFRQVHFAGSFEGDTTVGLGVRARLPFRVFTLAGPGAGTRLVIDVAHRW